MNILFVGRGIISTEYAWAFEKAGHRVEFYVREGKAAQYGGNVKLDFVDGRKGAKVQENWPITCRESLDNSMNYDLIVVSVNHYQLSGVIDVLAPYIGKATVLLFNNLWEDPLKAIAPIPPEQVVWGFPGGGGGFYSDGTLRGGFLKLMFLGKVGDSGSGERYKSVYTLFKNAGFSVSQSRDFRSWLWIKFVMNAALEAMAIKAGSYGKLFDSPKYTKQAALLMKEMMPLLKAKGAKMGSGPGILLHLPAGLTGFILHKTMPKGSLGRDIMEHCELTGHVAQEAANTFSRDIMKEARELGISLPGLESL